MRMADTSSTVPQSSAAACLVGDLVVGELAKRAPLPGGDRGHSVFQERIIGNPRKSQGRIITRALLLSDEAKIGNKLELQIFGIAMRAGTHCAMPLIERFGVATTCHASLALYNTHADVDALAPAVIAAGSHKRGRKVATDGSVASPHQYVNSY